jgi:hypothetical protein
VRVPIPLIEASRFNSFHHDVQGSAGEVGPERCLKCCCVTGGDVCFCLKWHPALTCASSIGDVADLHQIPISELYGDLLNRVEMIVST